MNHTPLGEVCLALGLLRPEDVDTILERMETSEGARFGDVGIRLGLLDDEGLARALAHQFRLNMVPRDRLRRLAVAPAVLDLLPRGLVRERLLVPTFLDEEKRVLSLLTSDPTDIPSLRAAQTAARAARLRLFVAPEGGMRELVERLLPPESADEEPSVGGGVHVEPATRGMSVVFEPDPDRAAAVRRLEHAEDGGAVVVGDVEQVRAYIESNPADRVFFRRALLSEVEPHLPEWRRLRPLVQVCALDGYGPSRRVAIPYDRTRDFFFGILEQLTARDSGEARGSRALELARAMAERLRLPDEHRDTVVLAAIVVDLADTTVLPESVDDAGRVAWAAEVVRPWSSPYGVQALFEALLPRVRGESGPGGHVGAEILYTARAAARAGAHAGDDPLTVLGADAARHDAAALRALAEVLAAREPTRPATRPAAAAREPARVDDVDTTGPSLLGAVRRILRRGPTPPALTGRVAEFSLVDLLQALAQGGRTAQVCVKGTTESGLLQLREGRLAAAVYEGRGGEDALQALVAMGEGQFEVRFEDGGLTNLSGATEFLVLEAVRRRDERRA